MRICRQGGGKSKAGEKRRRTNEIGVIRPKLLVQFDCARFIYRISECRPDGDDGVDSFPRLALTLTMALLLVIVNAAHGLSGYGRVTGQGGDIESAETSVAEEAAKVRFCDSLGRYVKFARRCILHVKRFEGAQFECKQAFSWNLKLAREWVNSCAGPRTNEFIPEESFLVHGGSLCGGGVRVCCSRLRNAHRYSGSSSEKKEFERARRGRVTVIMRATGGRPCLWKKY